MHTIVELPEYKKAVNKLLSDDENKFIIDYLAGNPKSGALIKGTGGVRKLRWAKDGSGKSGGVRIIYYYHNETIPLFLLTLFGKNQKENLSNSERNILFKLTSALVKAYESKK
ncbi:type II toxin-antitoxin system RelE/ParE family toxin [Agaribacter flavus]|uniref:Type II toxin-antitoxin system RelE/ParE family toxin n=1 Tax=Agaribacter flavus TaxID=1902781 RepID=A0ABV7FTC7_9ALTE